MNIWFEEEINGLVLAWKWMWAVKNYQTINRMVHAVPNDNIKLKLDYYMDYNIICIILIINVYYIIIYKFNVQNLVEWIEHTNIWLTMCSFNEYKSQ